MSMQEVFKNHNIGYRELLCMIQDICVDISLLHPTYIASIGYIGYDHSICLTLERRENMTKDPGGVGDSSAFWNRYIFLPKDCEKDVDERDIDRLRSIFEYLHFIAWSNQSGQGDLFQ